MLQILVWFSELDWGLITFWLIAIIIVGEFIANLFPYER